MKIICISAKAQGGKDTVATFLKYTLEDNGYKVLITHYADLVKYVCKKFFGWNGEKDEKGRSVLQYVGTDMVRSQQPNYWVNFIADMLTFFNDEWDYVLIPDCRFPNEVDVLVNKGFDTTLVRVERPNFVSSLTEEQQQHPSETAMDNYKPDCTIVNDGDLYELRTKVNSLAKSIMQSGEIT